MIAYKRGFRQDKPIKPKGDLQGKQKVVEGDISW